MSERLSHLVSIVLLKTTVKMRRRSRRVSGRLGHIRLLRKQIGWFLPHRSRFRKRCFEKQIFSTRDMQYTCKMKGVRWKILEELWHASMTESVGLHVCYKWTTVKANWRFYNPLAHVNHSCFLHRQTLFGFQLKKFFTIVEPGTATDRAYTRRIHRISSVCKYCRCSAAVTMVRMRAKFVGPFGRNGRHLQTISEKEYCCVTEKLEIRLRRL
jgi:hypothetical protein